MTDFNYIDVYFSDIKKSGGQQPRAGMVSPQHQRSANPSAWPPAPGVVSWSKMAAAAPAVASMFPGKEKEERVRAKRQISCQVSPL